MGSFDCYCALCSGPLGKTWVKFGSKEAKWLARRARRLDLIKRKLAGEDVNESDEDYDEDSEDEAANEDHDTAPEVQCGDPKDSAADQTTEDFEESDEDSDDEEPRSVDAYDEKVSYDPTMLDLEVDWLDQGHVVGLNREDPDDLLAFISGTGEYEDYGVFRIEQPGGDPNDPQESQYSCYTTMNDDEDPVFPFHRRCLSFMVMAIGEKRTDLIDTKVLYTVFSQHREDWAPALQLNYGDIGGPQQFWESVSGEEYVVADIGPNMKVGNILHDLVPTQLFTRDDQPLDLAQKVRSDPLAVLPYEIICGILEELCLDDMRSLMQSSWSVFSKTRDNGFWKQKLRTLIFSWFREASIILGKYCDFENLNWKDLFLWLENVTKPKFGMSGPFMGIANRRRIWKAFQPLVIQYKDIVRPQAQIETTESEIKAIFESSRSLYTAAVAYPVPPTARTVSTQFVHSWGETLHCSSVFDSFWNPNGALIGISIKYSGARARVFGSTNGRPGKPFYIPAGDWIEELLIHTDNVDMFSEDQDPSQAKATSTNMPNGTAYIRSLTVRLFGGVAKHVRRAAGKYINVRPFVVLPGQYLIGLTGKIAESGEICCLGLLQSPKPNVAQITQPSYKDAQKLLLNHSGLDIYCNPKHGYSNEIWSHPYLDIRRLASQDSPTGLQPFDIDIAMDMIPWQICLWASRTETYKSLERISCFQLVSDTTHSDSYISGLQVEFSHAFQQMAGNGGPLPMQKPEPETIEIPTKLPLAWSANITRNPFEESGMEHFEIDGAGGEVITEVHASNDMKAVKLYTNRNRICYFGAKDRQQWLQYKAEEGQLIVGLACAFGEVAGWTSNSKTYSRWILSGIGVVTAPSEELEQQ